MNVSTKINVKYQRLNINIDLLSKLIDIIKDNEEYFATTSEDMKKVFEYSHWIMLDFHILLNKYFQEKNADIFLNQYLKSYKEMTQRINEAIHICIRIIIINESYIIKKIINEYRNEILSNNATEKLYHIEEYVNLIENEYERYGRKKIIQTIDQLTKDFNFCLGKLKILNDLKNKNRKNSLKDKLINLGINIIVSIASLIVGVKYGTDIANFFATG